jgi:hypothetical protein
MKYLPFEDFEIRTHLTSDEVFYRLRAAVDTQRKWWIFTNKPFWGSVERHYFRIWRAYWGNRNTPLVTGNIRPQESGCMICARARMPWLAFIFMCIWLGTLWFLFFLSIVDLIVTRFQTGAWAIESPFVLLIPIGMFAFGYFISFGLFRSEARYIKKYLLWLAGTGEESIK